MNTYDVNGLRTKRTNGSTTYNYVSSGSQLVQMTVGSHKLEFFYDASGAPVVVLWYGIPPSVECVQALLKALSVD